MAEHFRRTDPRYLRRLEVELLVAGERYHGLSRNISLGGLFVELDAALPLGAKVDVRFRVPTQPEPIEVSGEIRWIEPHSPDRPAGVAVRFQGLRAREVWALNRFFQT